MYPGKVLATLAKKIIEQVREAFAWPDSFYHREPVPCCYYTALRLSCYRLDTELRR